MSGHALAAGLLLALGVVGAASCARREAPPAPPPVQEAYQLMDRGENAKAIALLEQMLEGEPRNHEATVLLASAYLGQCGVNVYSIHDSFKDVIFTKPLGDSFWGNPTGKFGPKEDEVDEIALAPSPPPGQPGDAEAEERTTMMQLAERVGNGLTGFRKIANFLIRFPDVPEEKWPYLQHSLALLSRHDTDEKDLLLYRVFARLIYLKAYLDHRVMRNPDFGTREWACKVKLPEFEEDLDWVSGQLRLASDDFTRVFPDRASSLERIQIGIGLIEQEIVASGQNPVPGAGTGMGALQSRMRKAFKCD